PGAHGAGLRHALDGTEGPRARRGRPALRHARRGQSGVRETRRRDRRRYSAGRAEVFRAGSAQRSLHAARRDAAESTGGSRRARPVCCIRPGGEMMRYLPNPPSPFPTRSFLTREGGVGSLIRCIKSCLPHLTERADSKRTYNLTSPPSLAPIGFIMGAGREGGRGVRFLLCAAL